MQNYGPLQFHKALDSEPASSSTNTSLIPAAIVISTVFSYVTKQTSLSRGNRNHTYFKKKSNTTIKFLLAAICAEHSPLQTSLTAAVCSPFKWIYNTERASCNVQFSTVNWQNQYLDKIQVVFHNIEEIFLATRQVIVHAHACLCCYDSDKDYVNTLKHI